MTDEAEIDPRLLPFGRAECFICARRILVLSDYCNVESPASNNVKLAAHIDCVNSMDGLQLIARYQCAAFAALSGDGQKEMPWTPPPTM